MEKFPSNWCCHQASAFQKWAVCVSISFAHVLEMGTATLKAHLNTLQEADAYPLRDVCSHFTHVLLDAETQLLQATELVPVSSGLFTGLNSTR